MHTVPLLYANAFEAVRTTGAFKLRVPGELAGVCEVNYVICRRVAFSLNF